MKVISKIRSDLTHADILDVIGEEMLKLGVDSLGLHFSND